jgi:hypothetical protein
MTRYRFYEVRSARGGQYDPAERDTTRLYRDSFACAERPDLAIFVWRRGNGEVQAFQFLFGEQWVEWSPSRGTNAGSTNRVADDSDTTGGRFKGVRTLETGGDAAAVIEAARGIVEQAEMPEELVVAFGEAGLR